MEDHGWVVALDTVLTDELILEGVARDIIRQVATCRKEADFKVDDRITLAFDAQGDAQSKVLEAARIHEEFIRAENLANEIVFAFEEKEFTKEVKIGGEAVRLSIGRV